MSSSEQPVGRGGESDSGATDRKPGDWFTVFLVLAVVGLGVLVVMLTRENRRLRAMAQGSQAVYPPDAIQAGDLVPAMRLVNRAGEEITEDFRSTQGRQVLVLLVGRHCPYCLETLPRWNALLEQLQGARPRVICIQSDAKVKEDLMDLPEHIAGFIAAEPMKSWVRHIPVEPGAVLIGPDGVVKGVWYGVPTEAQLEEMGRSALGG